MKDKTIYTIEGKSGTLKTLCDYFGKSERLVQQRMKRGLTLQDALLMPIYACRQKKDPQEPKKRKPVFIRISASGGYYA